AIVGINGAGKTTLLRIIVGESSADSGDVTIMRGKTIGYLKQQDMLGSGRNIYDETIEARRDLLDMEADLRSLEEQMNSLSGESLDTLMDRYHQLQTKFERENGYALRSEVSGVLKGLGFTEDEFSKMTDTLSGGQRTRVALGKLLLSSPDIILLDEPTNHLDIQSIAWLENYLRNYGGAVVIVSHDRYFLDKIVTKVVELDLGRSVTFQGNYTSYAEKKQQLRDNALKAWMKQQQEIRHQEAVIEKLRSFNREKSIKRAESREKMLDKMDVLEKPVDENTEMKLLLEPDITSGNEVLNIRGLSKAFDREVLFSGIDLQIRRGERAALIGDNGTGKTTLLKIINGMMDADEGTITLGTNVHIGYYDQEHQVLHPDKTLFEEISDEYPDLTNTRIRNVLAAFLFTGDDVYKRIKDISGGERGRVSLAKLMLSSANFLILDEPTNHLDIVSKEILENALRSYTGTILYVSHDRYFINRTATRVLHLDGQVLTNYLGNYDYFVEKRDAAAAAGNAPVPLSRGQAGAQTGQGSAEDTSRTDWEKQKEEQARLRKRRNDLKRTEDEISALEEEDARIDEQLTKEEVFTDLQKCTELTNRKGEIASRLETLYELWEELAQ
nr:ABC-F family ATP-binding cassette domain-containing protein [Lachnospiraceae bacterium]